MVCPWAAVQGEWGRHRMRGGGAGWPGLGTGSGQGWDRDHGAMPPVKEGETRLMQGSCGEEMIGDRVEGYPR